MSTFAPLHGGFGGQPSAKAGGEGGIRTPETFAGLPALQAGALDQLCDLSK